MIGQLLLPRWSGVQLFMVRPMQLSLMLHYPKLSHLNTSSPSPAFYTKYAADDSQLWGPLVKTSSLIKSHHSPHSRLVAMRRADREDASARQPKNKSTSQDSSDPRYSSYYTSENSNVYSSPELWSVCSAEADSKVITTARPSIRNRSSV